MSDIGSALRAAFGDRARQHVPLAPFTTFKVGGPADWFLETRHSDEIVTALSVATACGVPMTVLGGGSNVLVADAGVRGVVIRTRGGDVSMAGPGVVRADADDNYDLYGSGVAPKDVVMNGSVKAPAAASSFMAALHR